MYSPVISTFEHPLNPLPSGKDSVPSLLPLQSFSERTPFLVEISSFSGLGQINFNASEQEYSPLLDTTLSAETNNYSEGFWSRPNSLERS